MPMLTAKDAKKISDANAPENIEERLSSITTLILEAANNGKREVRLPHYFVRSPTTSEGDVSLSKIGQKLAELLEKNGYTITPIWDCSGQFVDMYFKLSW